MEEVLVKVWHGGTISKEPNLHYEGGETNMFKVDVDKMSYFELVDFVMEFGSYKSKDFLMYYLVPGKKFEEGLVELHSDADVNEMMNALGEEIRHILHLYVQGMTTAAHKSTKSDIAQPSNIEAHIEAHLNQHVETPNSTPTKGITKSAARRLPLNISLENNSHSSTDDEEWFESEDLSEKRDEIIGSGSDTDDEEWFESVNAIQIVNKKDELSKKKLVEDFLKEVPVTYEKKVTDWLDDSSSYEESDGNINSPGNSDDDDIRGKKYKAIVPVVTETTDWSKWEWVVGTRFPTRAAFKDAVRNYAVSRGRNVYIQCSNKNRQGRIGVQCETGCPFNIYMSFHEGKGCYMVKSVQAEHTCQRNMAKNRQLTADYLASQFLPIFKANPYWSAKEIQTAVKEKYKVLITHWLAYKAKSAAHKKLHGSMQEHYSKMGSYLEALKQVNPTSTFQLETVPSEYHGSDSGNEVFFRIFVCFDGVKKGFLAGCRRLLCVDGCFLKTFLGGMLLAAIGRDANDQMFPVAWAVVEGENNDSWTWFMNELKNCLQVTNEGKGWTLISDQQKGLLNAVCLVWSNAEHRNCARHIYANWHKKFKGDDLKGAFWKAVRAYSEADYKKAILEMKYLSNDATEAFIHQNPRCFCRCFFDTETKADMVVNNMAETFNGYIIKSRSKHIINMLEDIRLAIMTRLTKMSTQMSAKDVTVCPRIQMKLDKEKDRAYKREVYPSSSTLFQVKELDDVVVDLTKKSCTCRKWDLTGIPCYHVCAVAGFIRNRAEDFVDSSYNKEKYLKSYEFTIPPLPSEKYWPFVELPLDPPPIKIGPGRPKKNRRKDPHEDPKRPGVLSRHGMVMTCSNCKGKGHNKRKCTEKSSTTPAEPKKPRGRLRKGTQEASIVVVESSHAHFQSTQGTQQSTVTNQQPIQQKKPRGRPRKGTK